MKARISDKNSQQGWVLVIGLVVLVMLTLIAMALMRTTLLEEKMAGASRDINLSFEAAEAGLRGAEALSKVRRTTVHSPQQAQVFMRREQQPVIWSRHPLAPIGTMTTPGSYRARQPG